MLLIVIYDSRKRAPASEGDVLGIMSLGYPISEPYKCFRVRRDIETIAYHNSFENKGFD
jgi:hypothetical protein